MVPPVLYESSVAVASIRAPSRRMGISTARAAAMRKKRVTRNFMVENEWMQPRLRRSEALSRWWLMMDARLDGKDHDFFYTR